VGECVNMAADAGAVLLGAWPGQRAIEWIASHPLETLQSVLGLGFVIFVHELGHFLVAKACGVKCEKFYLGFDVGGLKLCSFKWGETEYGIGALPLGGYVKMLGQDDNPGAPPPRPIGPAPRVISPPNRPPTRIRPGIRAATRRSRCRSGWRSSPPA